MGRAMRCRGKSGCARNQMISKMHETGSGLIGNMDASMNSIRVYWVVLLCYCLEQPKQPYQPDGTVKFWRDCQTSQSRSHRT